MPVVKQSQPRKYIENLDTFLSLDFKGMTIQEFDYYNECCKHLSSKGLYTNEFARLFDYFLFVYCKSDKDLSKDIKMQIKSMNLDSNDLLVYIHRLTSSLIRLSVDMKKYLSELVLCVAVVLNSFKLFLMYGFDITYSGKKLLYDEGVGKYKDLDDIISLLAEKDDNFSKDLVLLLLKDTEREKSGILDSLKGKVLKDTVEGVDFALFQKAKFKYDYLLLQYLIGSLLKDEYSYYSKKLSLKTHILSSIMCECVEGEYNLELTSEFYTLLRKRAYLIPSSGINLNPSDIGFNLDIYERQFNGDNYLVIITTVELEEISYFTFINLSKGYTINNSPWLYDICNFLYSFYRLDEYAQDLYGEEYSNDPRIVLSFKTEGFFSEGVHVIKGKSKVYDDFIVESPYYWRYKGSSLSKPQKKKDFLEDIHKNEKFIYISAFKRKLPDGSRASKEALELAKVYCLELGEGETLVSPFIRVDRR